MKSQLFFSLLMALSFASCSGGGKSTVNLEITRAFATSNSNFDGGLFIHGKNMGTGDEFSFALSTLQNASVTLAFGTWDIRVVGWDNGAVGDNFMGDVLCAHEIVNFKSVNQSIALQVTGAKCQDNAFASLNANSTLSYTEPAGGTAFKFKQFNVFTCGALYDLANPAQIRTDAFPPAFCDGYPLAFRQHSKSMKVNLHNRLPGAGITAGLSSQCIPYTVTYKAMLSSLRLPTKIPLTIELFEDTGCANLQGTYHFDKGVEDSAATPFDYLIRPDGTIMLALAAPLSQRGTSSLLTETPFMRCNVANDSDPGVPCIILPPMPGGANYVLQQGHNSIMIPNVAICGAPFSNNGGTNDIVMSGCEVKNGNTHMNMEVDQGISDSTTLTFNYNSIPYTAYIKQGFNGIMRDMVKSLGHGITNNTFLNSIKEKGGNHGTQDQSSGKFDNVVEFLSPSILGGFYWDQPCNANTVPAPVKRFLTFWDEGDLRHAYAIMTNPPNVNVPGYISNSNPRSTVGSNPFNRRFIIRDLNTLVNAYETRMIVDIACDTTNVFSNSLNIKIGRSEESHYEIDGSETRDERTIMYWNASSPDKARYEIYNYEYSEEAGVVQYIKSSFERAEKLPDANQQKSLRVTRLNYEFFYQDITNNGLTSDDTYSESTRHTETDVNANNIFLREPASYNLRSVPPTTIAPGSFFGSDLMKSEIDKVRYDFIPSTTIPTVVKTHSSGKWVRSVANGTQIQLESFNGITYGTPFTLSIVPSNISIDLSPNGNFAIVAAVDSGTPLNVHIFTYSGGAWTNRGIATVGGSATTVPQIQTTIQNTGNFLIATLSNNSKINWLLGTTSVVGAFQEMPTLLPLAFSVTNDSINNYLLYYHTSGSAPTAHIFTMCIPSGASCTDIPISTFTAPDDENLKDFYAFIDSSNQLAFSYNFVDTSPVLSLKSVLNTFDGTVWTEYEYDNTTHILDAKIPYEMAIQSNNATGSGSTSLVNIVQVPYVSPVIPGFAMNFRSLDPTTMPNQVFTNPNTFSAIGSGL